MCTSLELHGSPFLPDRIASKIDFDGPGGCWVWTASLRDGYGQVRCGKSVRQAHLVVYELLVGEVPEGLELDHLCRVRVCVNPAHLEPVTKRVNILRGDAPPAHLARRTHCFRGHVFAGRDAHGYRTCGICRPIVAPLAA